MEKMRHISFRIVALRCVVLCFLLTLNMLCLHTNSDFGGIKNQKINIDVCYVWQFTVFCDSKTWKLSEVICSSEILCMFMLACSRWYCLCAYIKCSIFRHYLKNTRTKKATIPLGYRCGSRLHSNLFFNHKVFLRFVYFMLYLLSTAPGIVVVVVRNEIENKTAMYGECKNI